MGLLPPPVRAGRRVWSWVQDLSIACNYRIKMYFVDLVVTRGVILS